MYNIHLEHLKRVRWCDPSGGMITMGIISAVSAGVQMYGQQQEGAAKSRMYKDAAYNTDVQAQMARETAATNVMLTKRDMEQNIHATQMDASMKAKELGNTDILLQGSQKAASAASGVGGGSVTQADIAQDTLDKVKMDEIAIRYNADSESANTTNAGNNRIWSINNDLQNQVWGLGVQKSQYEAAAKNAKQAANIQSLGTILSTATSVGDMGFRYGAFKLPTNATASKAVATNLSKNYKNFAATKANSGWGAW